MNTSTLIDFIEISPALPRNSRLFLYGAAKAIFGPHSGHNNDASERATDVCTG